MNKAYLLIGGNMGNRKKQLEKAAIRIEKTCGTIALQSHFYETAAWGKTDQSSFYNQALAVNTALSAPELLDVILRESQYWRNQFSTWKEQVGHSTFIPSAENFMDIAELMKLLQDPHNK